jgi:hypothetical protein
MNIKVKFNTDDFIENMKNVNIACNNLAKAMAKYMAKNKYKILKELIEERGWPHLYNQNNSTGIKFWYKVKK